MRHLFSVSYFCSVYITVGNSVNNGISVVVPKMKKMSYVEAARTARIVDNQNRLIANGGDPLDH